MRLKALLLFVCSLAVPSLHAYSDETPLLFLGNHKYPPLIYMDDSVPTGVVVDIAHALEGASGLKINVVAMDWSKAQQLVLDGDADALLQINPTKERNELYDFSDPLLKSEFTVFKKVNRDDLHDLKSLQSSTVGVEQRGFPMEFLSKHPRIHIRIIPTWKRGFELLLADSLDAVVVDRWVGEYVLATNRITGIKSSETPIATNYSSIAVKKGNRALLMKINAGLKVMNSNGKMASILRKWRGKHVVYFTNEQFLQMLFLGMAIILGLISIISILYILKTNKINARQKAQLNQIENIGNNIDTGMIYQLHLKNDGTRTFTYVSQQAKALYGCSPQDIIDGSHHVFGKLDDENMSKLQHEEASAVAQNRSLHCELTISNPNGTKRISELRAKATRLDNNTIRWDGIEFVITERKQIEESIRASASLLRKIAENYPNSYLTIIEKNFSVGFASGQELKKNHHSPDDVAGLTLEQFYHDNSGVLRPYVTRSFNGEECTFKTFNNGQYQLFHSVPLTSDDGTVRSVLVVAENITSRTLSEAALLESEERYRSMMEAMDDLVYICSSDMKIEYANTALNSLVKDTIVGKRCYSALYGFDEQCTWCPYSETLAGKHAHCEIVNPRDTRTYHLSSSPIQHNDGTVSQLVILRDISDIITMQSRLEQAQRMEVIGQLAGGIAHDFNNILSAIMGFADMVLEDFAPDSQNAHFMRNILAASERAKNLVAQILTFSRKGREEKRPIYLRPIISEVATMLQASLPSTISLNITAEKDTEPVLANSTKVHEALMNLAMNAMHALSEKGEVSITLKELCLSSPQQGVIATLQPGFYSLVEVSDNGTGIPIEILNHIFEPFYTTKHSGKGTGLGLAVVYGVMQSHGGDILVKSEFGKGTTFSLFFPKTNLKLPEESVPVTDTMQGSESILFVDDEHLIVEMAKNLFSSLGYRITALTNSTEAFEMFSRYPQDFDILITDQTMPHLTGIELADKIHQIRPHFPIILCTGFSSVVDEKVAAENNIRFFCYKPVDKSDLVRKVRQALDAE